MSFEITGTITKILELQTGTSKANKEWKKVSFVVDTSDEYNNIYCFEVFGDEKVDGFLKHNKTGDTVKVDFNVKTSDEFNGRYYTDLQAWKIFKAEGGAKDAAGELEPQEDDLPFPM